MSCQEYSYPADPESSLIVSIMSQPGCQAVCESDHVQQFNQEINLTNKGKEMYS